jgi:hypothetical protein
MVMFVSLRTGRNILVILIALLSLSCNDYSSILPQSGVYKVAVYVDSTPLEMNGFVSSQKTFKPAFITPVASDPDVQGLAVSIKNSQNVPMATEIVYTKTAVESAGTRVIVPNLDSTLPEFAIPKDLPIGPYKIVLKVLGSNTVLSEKEFPFYYLADAVLTIKDIHSFPPGYKPSISAPLFPPQVNLLLEGAVQSDVRLDPYIVWYEGNRILNEGRLAEGANKLLWKTPEAEGFQTIRCELYPENPGSDKNARNIPSVSSSLRIAISKTAPIPGIDFAANNYSLWYHFLGTLSSEKIDGTSTTLRTKKGSTEPLWLSGEDTYGLAVGEAHQYTIDTPILPASERQISEGSLVMRFAPAVQEANGALFYAQFYNQNKIDEPLVIRLYIEGGILKLQAEIGKESVQAPITNQKLTAKTFYNIELEIKQSDNTLTFSIPKSSNPLLAINLPENFSYSGAGSYGFGEQKAKTSETPVTSEAIPEEMNQDSSQTAPALNMPVPKTNPVIAIIDEFGLKF